jgi:hypothetical protein
MVPETATIKAMTDVDTVELQPKQGHKTVISPFSFLDKSGSQEPIEAKTGSVSPQELDRWLNRSFGTALHTAFRQLAAKKLIAETSQQLHQTRQLEMELPRPAVAEIVGADIHSWEEFCQKVADPQQQFNPEAVTKAVAWQKSFQSYTLPKTIIDRLNPEQKKFFNEQKTLTLQAHAVLLCGLIEFWPPFNQPDTLVLSEVRFQPPTFAVEKLGKSLNRPGELNLNQALAAGINQGENLDDFLFRKLVKKQPLLAGFEPLVTKLKALNLIDGPETLMQLLTAAKEADFNQKFEPKINSRDLETSELTTLQALRLVHQARLQMEFFLGGKALMKTKQELSELLQIFPLTASPDNLPPEEFDAVWAKLPRKMQRILSPIFMAADILVLTMPNEPEEKTTGCLPTEIKFLWP